MTTTAHEDQFKTEPDQESECRQERAKTLDVCVWIEHYEGRAGHLAGCNVYEWPFIEIFDEDFKFCPFCGKKIEVKK